MFKLLISALAVAVAASAQSVLVVPAGAAAAEQNSLSSPQPISGLSSPFAGTGGVSRAQWTYDATNFTSQGVTTPILITQMRLRANGGNDNWVGGTVPNIVVDMSTGADYTGITTTFDANHGSDRTTVYNNSITVAAGSSVSTTAGAPPSSPWSVTLDLLGAGQPFTYAPALGDLVIDFMTAGFSGVVAGNLPSWDMATSSNVPPPLAARVFNNNNSQFAPTGLATQSIGLVIEVTYLPVAGPFAAFTATPTVGGSPLNVAFTDLSSSTNGPITSWAWDFENDGTIDSTLQNPVHVFPCGTYDVSLTVGDGLASITRVQPAFIVTDIVTPSFTWAPITPSAVQFTDTTTPAATSWAWDFDDDGTVDSTQQNPVHDFGGCVQADVVLTANANCGPLASVTNRVVSGLSLDTTFAGGSSGSSNWAAFFDLTITNPTGVELCGLDTRSGAAVGAPFPVDIYLTPITSVGAEGDSTIWRRVAQATGIGGGNSSTGNVRSFVPLPGGIYLAPGSYGVMVHYPTGGTSWTYSGSSAPQTFGNADLSFSNPRVRAGLFTGTLFNPRVWNGTFYYTSCSLAGEAAFGYFQNGCAGSQGVPGMTASSDPVLGGTMNATVSNCPQDAAVVVLGFSNTVSPFGALPLDLTPFGLTGCAAHVSSDSTQFRLGAGNQVNWSLTIPNAAQLMCTQVYTQALVLDGPANPAGLTMSDAAAIVVGN